MRKMIVYENVPRWYDLSWQGNPPAIVVTFVKSALERLPDYVVAREYLLPQYQKELGVKTYSDSLDGHFGFDNAIEARTDGDKVVCTGHLPQVRWNTKSRCSYCKGGKRAPHSDQECPDCRGSGKAYELKWTPAFALSASLNALFFLAKFHEGETIPLPQLLTLTLVTQCGMHGGSLGGDFSQPLVDWLRARRPGEQIPEMMTAMRIAHDRMMGKQARFIARHEAYVQKDGWLLANCGGGSIHPAYGWIEKAGGYEFTCHNVDSPVQQLTLLAGLAALHDRVDRELFPPIPLLPMIVR